MSEMLKVDLFESFPISQPLLKRWNKNVLKNQVGFSDIFGRMYVNESRFVLFGRTQQHKNQVPESGASGTRPFAGDDLRSCTTQEKLPIGFRPWICMVIYGPKLRRHFMKAIVKGNAILGVCIPDVEHRCRANSFMIYCISLALSSCRLVTF